MRKYFYAIAALVITMPAAFAQSLTVKQLDSNAKAVAKAEQAVTMAACKLEFLQRQPGVSRSSVAYFGHMAECLTRTASK